MVNFWLKLFRSSSTFSSFIFVSRIHGRVSKNSYIRTQIDKSKSTSFVQCSCVAKMSVNRTLCTFVSSYTRNPSISMQIRYTPSRFSTSSSSNNTNKSNNCGLNKFTRRSLAPRSHNYTTALSNMTKDQANDLVFRLNDQERQLLLQVLTQFQVSHERQQIEGKCHVPTYALSVHLAVIDTWLPKVSRDFLFNFLMQKC